MKHKHGSHCETYYDVMAKLRQSFGDAFDDLPFQSHSSAGGLTGADFNGVVTGCEILDRQGLGWMCQCRPFDVKLRLVSDEALLKPGTQYKVTMSGGHVVSGCIDDKGCTERIRSSEAQALEKIEVEVDDLSACCGQQHADPIVLSVDLTGVQTSMDGFGESEKKITVKKGYRSLTVGEKELARLVFKGAINYSVVRVYNKKYLPFQPERMAMAPNGNIYFHPSDFREDFSLENVWLKRWFVHEMTHVWQHQLGYPVFWRGAVRFGLSYKYELSEGRRLSDYNMEAQGDVLADYFVLKFMERPGAVGMNQYAASLWLYEDVLGEFINNPSSTINLP